MYNLLLCVISSVIVLLSKLVPGSHGQQKACEVEDDGLSQFSDSQVAMIKVTNQVFYLHDFSAPEALRSHADKKPDY
jgi:hypothetical protein